MRFDRDLYFDNVRQNPFPGKLNQQQVDGQEAILGGWETKQGTDLDVRFLAYELATTYHETAATMQPISEYGGESYLKTKPYYPYYGRGYVQLTWEDNYRRATDELGLKPDIDLVKTPDDALRPDIAYAVMDRGMAEGWFTGKKLSDYFNATKDDPVNARAIINSDVSKNGAMIAGYHQAFEDALNESEITDGQGDPVVTISIAEGSIVIAIEAHQSSIKIDGKPL